MGKKSNSIALPNGVPLDAAGVVLHPTSYKMDANAQRYMAYMSNLSRLLDIAISVFKWENLPDGVDSHMIEWWLLSYGCLLFFYDPDMVGSEDAPEGYAALPATVAGGFDLYGYPKSRRAYSVNGYNRMFTDSDSVSIYNSQLRWPMFPTIKWYAERLSNADLAMDLNILNQKTSKIAVCDERTKLSMKNIANEYDDYVSWIFTTKNFDPNSIQELDLSASFVAADVMDVRNQIFNQALTFVGVENVNTDKKERLVAGEVYGGMGAVEAQRFTRLVARQKAADEINKMFGLDVSVDFRSGAYIRTDKEGRVPTGGMVDGVNNITSTYDEMA